MAILAQGSCHLFRNGSYEPSTISSAAASDGRFLQSNVCSSLHGLLGTRWTDRVASVRPFRLLLIFKVSKLQLLELNLTPKKTTIDVNGAIRYVSSFICIVMSAVWLKILVAIDQRNQILQAKHSTIDVEVANLHSLVADLKRLHDMASNFPGDRSSCHCDEHLSWISNERKSKLQLLDDPEISLSSSDEGIFKRDVFYVAIAIDSVIAGITTRYESNEWYLSFRLAISWVYWWHFLSK